MSWGKPSDTKPLLYTHPTVVEALDDRKQLVIYIRLETPRSLMTFFHADRGQRDARFNTMMMFGSCLCYFSVLDSTHHPADYILDTAGMVIYAFLSLSLCLSCFERDQ